MKDGNKMCNHLIIHRGVENNLLKVRERKIILTRADFGAQPLLDAILVNILQAACAAAGLDQRVGGRLLTHLANTTQVPFLLVRVLQQQATGERKKGLFTDINHSNQRKTTE